MNIMKTIRNILIIVVLCLCTTTMAQMPRTISYQGVLADASGNFISDGNHTLALKIYDASGAVLYSETQTAVVVKGLFNVMIGSTSGLPSNLSFDKAYYLGVGVDGGSELSPRTPLSASPYAFRAQVAEQALALSPNATGVVTKVNNHSGSLKLIGGGATTVTTSNDTILISSSGGGGASGVQGVQNSDGAISITNPNGPVATLGISQSGITSGMLAANSVTGDKIVNGSITNAKIADGSISPLKLDGTGITTGYVLTKTAGAVAWGAVGGGLTLPYVNSTSNASTLFDISNTGAGKTASFKTTNSTSLDTTLHVESNSSASSLSIRNTNTSNTQDVLTVTGAGVGSIGSFSATNTSNLNAAIEAITVGSGGGTSSTSGVSAVLGMVNNTSAGAYSSGVRGLNTASNNNGYGVVGVHYSGGIGVYGESPSGKGVQGVASGTNAGIGVYGVGNGTNAIGVEAEYAGNNASGAALQITNGYLKVAGNKRTAFQHLTTVANINANTTILNYPGMAATDLLIITHRLNNAALIGGCGVWWNGAAWVIVNENAALNMPVGEAFNVLVVKQ